MSNTPLQLAIIMGSTRKERFCPVPATWFAGEAAKYEGIAVDLIDLTDFELPDTLDHSVDVAALGPRLAAADAFVVVTPEYNHSYPAALKTAIDHFHREWQAKPVGFVSYGGMAGGLRAVEHLRHVFAELHATTVRDTLSFAQFWDRFDDDGVPKDAEQANAAARAMLDQLVWWGTALREARTARPYAA
ncbi:NAD(P)H-dependent FMN reductase [Prauserella shujinwangii]|uniref:NAD(P)H-dependent FMN reductase n=1 Tax=Prauserella shujinwangii TaxID=1453103 RepID=A0A2T0LMW1_9PSEU|nr:NAD(P)H-dependent oxidoreductase [Prauserella shujinwangii]PRX44523.1 NAD(P)H-dependent FMN reductase [Prauserella shujinwangii]